jgi:hypothetical protein
MISPESGAKKMLSSSMRAVVGPGEHHIPMKRQMKRVQMQKRMKEHKRTKIHIKLT